MRGARSLQRDHITCFSLGDPADLDSALTDWDWLPFRDSLM